MGTLSLEAQTKLEKDTAKKEAKAEAKADAALKKKMVRSHTALTNPSSSHHRFSDSVGITSRYTSPSFVFSPLMVLPQIGDDQTY
jgi:hypothetical protein